jgi:hypothetical protein
MILISKYILLKGYRAITLYPFVILKHKSLKDDAVLINHEKIHLKQQLELLIIPFYVWYVLEFVVRLIIYKNWLLAYKSISFEREAYAKENDLNYLKSRSFWSFIKYLR